MDYVLSTALPPGIASTLSAHQNATAEDKKRGIYRPQLTIVRRPPKYQGGSASITLYIQFSAPKLMFGNNFNELNESHFDKVCQKLNWHLLVMGVELRPGVLAQASVSAVHFGKNVELTDGSLPSFYLNEFHLADIPISRDVAEVCYRNGGLLFKHHTNHSEFVMYDKIQDLNQAKRSEKRAIEDDSFMQLDLFNHFETVRQKQAYEVIRLEVRLNNQRIIKKALSKAGYPNTPLQFKVLFNTEISRQVCLNFLDEVINKIPISLRYAENQPDEAFLTVYASNPKWSIERILAFTMSLLVVRRMETRAFRQICDARSSGAWRRIKKNLADVNIPKHTDYLSQLREKLSLFEPITPIEIVNEMLNNDKERESYE